VAENSNNFWRLFHCLLSHSTTEEEAIRTKATYAWFGDHLTTLRKISGLCSTGDTGEGLELMGVVWTLAASANDLPGLSIVQERVEKLERYEAVLELLKEYKERLPILQLHQAKDLDAVLKDCCDDWEQAAVQSMLQVANRICMGSIPLGKKKLSGPADALKYLHQRQEKGLLVKPNQTLRPINVNKEATTIGEWYDEYLNTQFLPTGIFDFESSREVLLETSSFVGILGYLHDGKSPVARHTGGFHTLKSTTPW
jgi:hypothetical protein